MQFRHSITAKTLCVIAAVFVLLAIFSTGHILNTYKEYRRMRLLEVKQAFYLQCQDVNKDVLLLQKSVQQLALQAEMYLGLPPNVRPVREQFVGRVLEEIPQAVGGGLWFEPYRDEHTKLRSSVYFSREGGVLHKDPIFESVEYDYLNQMWYRFIQEQAHQSLEVVWTPPYIDRNSTGHIPMTTVGCNLYHQGTFMGIVTLDWALADIVQRVSALLPTQGSFALFADLFYDVVLVNTSQEGGGFGSNVQDLPWLRHVGAGQNRFFFDGVQRIAFMKTMDNGMALILNIPEDELYASARHQLYSMLVGLAVFTLLLLGVTWYLLYRFISKPVRAIADKAVVIGSGDLDVSIHVTDKGELGMLAIVLNTMTENLQKHIASMHRLTQEKVRIAAELDIATRIQTAMLPCIFPPFPDRGEFGLYAFMRPAREVGGDFYDFFLVDDQHLAVIIADVSGKGVPAALFMVIAKTLLKNHMQSGLSPCAALAVTNNQLCENNSMNMFVTVWAGLLALESGHLCHSNAGHNRPLMSRNGAAHERFGSKRGLVLGGMHDTHYTDEHCTLAPGDRLLLYTDGITEAENPETCQFGLHNLQKSADAGLSFSLKTSALSVVAAVDFFASEAPQTDDITLLLLEYCGNQRGAENTLDTEGLVDNTQEQQTLADVWKSRIPADIAHFSSLRDRLEATLAQHHCPSRAKHHLLLALEEVFVNIVHYAYAEEQGEVSVECAIQACCEETMSAHDGDAMQAVLCFRDKGKAFNPLTHQVPDLTLSAAERVPGGLGIHMLQKIVDRLEYQRQNGENILTLTKLWRVPS